MKLFTLIKKNISFLIFLCVLLYLNFRSFGTAFDFFFCKDDWAWLWSANHNPTDFFGTTVGPTWAARTGLFMYPYVLYLHKLITNSDVWQFIGFILKYLNSVAVFFLLWVFTKRKDLSFLGSFLYASYSGGIEIYTWHKLNALAAFFVLLGFIFYKIFVDSFAYKYFFYSYMFFILSLMSYIGRATGLVMVIFLWNTLLLIAKDVSIKEKFKLIKVTIFISIQYLLLSSWIMSVENPPEGYFQVVLSKISLFISVIGNLLKNPFFVQDETGYLTVIDRMGLYLGSLLVIVAVFEAIRYLKKRKKNSELKFLFCSWIFLFYLTNWIFGGGGIYTFITSGHRYFALSAVGVVVLATFYLGTIRKPLMYILFIFLIVNSLKYSKQVIDSEYFLRNKYKVEPIYNQVIADTESEAKPPGILIIDTPNVLKSYVVQGWFSYAYGYYAGLKNISDFPMVFPVENIARQWICAKDSTEKNKILSQAGVVNYQGKDKYLKDEIYFWKLDEEGRLVNKTDFYRDSISGCLKI